VLGAGGTSTTNNYAYDGVGNFTMKSDYSTTANGAYQYRAGTNQLTQVSLLGGGTASFDYDDKGNLTHRNGNREATFNVFNKPTNINRLSSNVDLLYDANIERYKQVREVEGDTITTLYIDKVFEVETTVSGSQTTVEETTYLGGMAILREDVDGLQRSNPRIDFTHKDRLGSSATFTDHNGQLTARRSFDPFGKPKGGDWTYLSSTGLSARLYNNLQDTDMPTRRGYTDHEHLDEVEIIHMNGRIYDYNVGRFFSVDPFIQGVGNSQGINPYSYVMNNPLGFTDPSGYMTEGVEDLELKTERKQRRGSRIAQEVTTEASGTATDDNGAKVSFTATFSGDKVSSLNTDIGNQDGANRAGDDANESGTGDGASGTPKPTDSDGWEYTGQTKGVDTYQTVYTPPDTSTHEGVEHSVTAVGAIAGLTEEYAKNRRSTLGKRISQSGRTANALEKAKRLAKNVGRAAFGVYSGVRLLEANTKLSTMRTTEQKVDEIADATLDIAYGAIAFTGPIGIGIGIALTYWAVDTYYDGNAFKATKNAIISLNRREEYE
jgi:RHS repeat-associated protein